MLRSRKGLGQPSSRAISSPLQHFIWVWAAISGGSMNPARSLGPAMVSWKFEDIWIYVTAPIIGAVAGAFSYRVLCLDCRMNYRTSASPTTTFLWLVFFKIMKRPMPFDDQVDISSDESSSSDAEIGGLAGKQSIDDITIVQPANEIISEEALVLRRAQMYQEYMKELPIPSERGAIIPFYSWTGFGKSTKQLYKQPLHYLTNICLKQLDQNRIGADDEDIHLDTIIHPAKAEVFLWMMEETHRLTTSPHRLATLWLKDSMHKAFIDAYVPPP